MILPKSLVSDKVIITDNPSIRRSEGRYARHTGQCANVTEWAAPANVKM
jgi:hypothetical protein